MMRSGRVFARAWALPAALAALVLSASGAHTQAPGWVAQPTTRGCFYYERTENVPTSTKWNTSVWDGPCTPGQPITGSGTMTDATPFDPTQREGPQSRRYVTRQTFVGGYRNGPVSFESGAQWNNDPTWVVNRRGDYLTQMGCDVGRDGQIQAGCRPAVLAASSPPASASAARAPAPSPTATQPSPPPANVQQGVQRQQSNPVVTRHIHNPNNVGNECAKPQMVGNRQEFVNRCPWTVWVIWPGGMEDISVGESYPTMQRTEFTYFVCKKDERTGAGPYQTPEMRARNEIICQGD